MGRFVSERGVESEIVMTPIDALSSPSLDLEPKLIDMFLDHSVMTEMVLLVNNGNL